jgi:uncharacterized DUF497 family protein
MSAGRFVWDERKRVENLRKHGDDFVIVEDFEFDTAIVVIDDRKDYGELRYRAFGMIGRRLHVLIFTSRGEQTRIISLRRANDRERQRYVEAKEKGEADWHS